MSEQMKLLELQKRVEQLEDLLAQPRADELEATLQLMKKYDVQSLSLGMLRVELKYYQSFGGSIDFRPMVEGSGLQPKGADRE